MSAAHAPAPCRNGDTSGPMIKQRAVIGEFEHLRRASIKSGPVPNIMRSQRDARRPAYDDGTLLIKIRARSDWLVERGMASTSGGFEQMWAASANIGLGSTTRRVSPPAYCDSVSTPGGPASAWAVWCRLQRWLRHLPRRSSVCSCAASPAQARTSPSPILCGAGFVHDFTRTIQRELLGARGARPGRQLIN